MDFETNKKTETENKFQTLLQSLSQCKIDFINDKEECKRLKETNSKLEHEVKELREAEKSHRIHLLSSREMIGNLQDTVSQLVYLKRDMKKMKEEMMSKDGYVLDLEKERENWLQKHNETLMELKATHEKQMEEIIVSNEKKEKQLEHDTETQVAQFTCLIEELKAQIKQMDIEHRDKLHVVILEYEEKLQRSASQITQLQDQHAGVVSRTNANIDAYRRRLEEMEEKIKQSQFKQFLEHNPSQYDVVKVERPYSRQHNQYQETTIDLDQISEPPKSVSSSQRSKPSSQKPLQVNYYGNKPPGNAAVDKKGPFNIVKKRKLYNDKQFNDF